MSKDTIVIIPAVNEENSISNVVSAIRKQYPDFGVVVINDGSSDNTEKLALEAGAILLTHPYNLGYGASIQTGYKYAIRNNYSYLVQVDGDGQHDISRIGGLVEVLKSGEADVVLGSRFLMPDNYKMSIYRLIGIRFFQVLIRLLTGLKISDPTTGYQAMNRKVLKVLVKDLFPYDYPDTDIILLLSKLDMKIKEVPVRMYPNLDGKSMHGNPLNALYYMFKMLLSILVTKLRRY